jgi:hypothetical protein
MGFEVIGGEIAECRVPPFGVVISGIVADFQARLAQVAEAAAVEQFGFEPTSKKLRVGVIIAISPAAYALHGLVAGH